MNAKEVKTRMNNLNNAIVEDMKCPICFEFLNMPIYQCHNGHIICDSCCNNVTKCPTCGNPNYSRSLIAEKIAGKLFYSCKYKRCAFIDNYLDVKFHERSCILKPYQCPLDDICKMTEFFLYEDLCAHLNKMHKDSFLKSNRLDLYIQEMEKPKVFVSILYNCVFLIKHKYENDMVMFLVQKYLPYILTQPLKRFMFKIAIGRKKGNHMNFNFDVGLYQFNYLFSKTMPLWLSLPINLVKAFIDDSKRLSYELTIYQQSDDDSSESTTS